MNTYFKHRKLILDNIHLKKGSSILDLGCGDATMLRLFVKRFSCAKAVGYDLNGRAIRLGRFLNRFHGLLNITLMQDNLRKANLKGFDYIYLFLYPEFVADLEDRIFREVDTGTIIICNTFSFVKHTPYEIIHNKK
ncbi:class I SAM-dependent methyltransferase [Patescibacteria group bacterium]|nr:class I SAM-dependent methyltransferase [Patescibacteria group bacterium]